MTECEYIKICIGFNSVQNNELKHLRKLCWTIICGYADPKKLPNNEMAWWPITGDPVFKPISRQKVIKLHNVFKSLKFGVKK